MATISSLTALLGAAVDLVTDLIPIVDMSAAGAARNKKITVGELKEAIAPGTAAALDIDVDDTLAANSDSLIPTQQAVKAYVDTEIAGVGGGGVDVEDEGVSETAGATILNFTGAGVTASDAGGGQVDINIPGGGGISGIDVEDEGVSEATGATILNFTGAGVTATDAGGGQVDIAIPGGSGAWEHIETLSPSAAAEIASEAWAGGSYKRLMFLIELDCSTDATGVRVQFKINGGYKTSADYYSAGMHCSSGGTNSSEDDAGTTSAFILEASASWGAGNLATEALSCTMTINAPFGTVRPKRFKVDGSHGGPSGAQIDITGSGCYIGTDYAMALQGVKFFPSAGTITGTIEVYGLN